MEADHLTTSAGGGRIYPFVPHAMDIDPKDLEEFIDLYEKEYGEKLSLSEAREITSRLIFLYERLMEPLPDEVQG